MSATPTESPTVQGGKAPEPIAARLPTWAWLSLGVLATFLAGNRWGVPLVAWIAPLPFLVVASRLRSWRGQVVFYATFVIAVTAQVGKMITEPVGPSMALMFGVTGGTTLWLAFALWDLLARRQSEPFRIYLFMAVMVVTDWAGFRFSPAGSWAASAASQVNNLPLLQLAALGGLSLVGAVLAWPAAVLAAVLMSTNPRALAPHALACALGLGVVFTFGALRLDNQAGGPTLRVAGVTTRVTLSRGQASDAEVADNTEALFERSHLAIERGAQLIVWNEMATSMGPNDEPGFVERGRSFARTHNVELVLGYGVRLNETPVHFDNKYVWIGADGEVVESYTKHHPVPGEPVLRSDAPLRVLDRPWGTGAGAICYDFDFPALARQHAQGGTGLVVVPASDWRGVDPFHGLMSRFRAIEGGMSVLRPVRGATSFAFDAYGRIRASMSGWEEHDQVMLATLPTTQVPTLHTTLGDWPVWFSMLGLSAAGVATLKKRRGR